MQSCFRKSIGTRAMNGKISLRFLFPLIALVILIIALSTRMFDLPPIGRLMDPFTGAIQNENDLDLSSPGLKVDLPGLSGVVHVYFDERKVPHIYAGNTEDLYFTQGYVTASLRLWQMDFLSYASAGRLSEIFNDGLLLYDRAQRRMGVLEAAKNSLKLIEKDQETMQALSAYTKGVNAYISTLGYRQLPFEYKMLDYEPEAWTNLKTVLVMKSVAAMLSGYEEDHVMTNLMLALGEKRFNRLFPAYGTHCTPITNNQGGEFDSALAYTKKPDYLDYSFWTRSQDWK
jgi:penicillin amidase